MTHPEPPKGCPFFEHSQLDGWLFVIPQRDPYQLAIRLNVASPAERYAAACVAIVWLVPEGSLDVAVAEIHFQWCIYRKQARAEMEASNG